MINCIPSLSRFTEEHVSSKTIGADEVRAFRNLFLEVIENGSIESFLEDKETDALVNSYFINNKPSQLLLRDLVKNLNEEFLKLLKNTVPKSL